jgi:hypothetical protein
MRVKHLAEAIILQSMEDLWSDSQREECINFFAGEDFRTCASIAGIDIADQIKILNMIGKSIKGFQKTEEPGKKVSYKYTLPRHAVRELANT